MGDVRSICYLTRVSPFDRRAAKDFGVELELDRFEPEADSGVLHEKMASQIESLCKEGVDGIFVAIPNEIVLEEIELCLKLKVPVVSINAGPEYSKDLDLGESLQLRSIGIPRRHVVPFVFLTMRRFRTLPSRRHDRKERGNWGGQADGQGKPDEEGPVPHARAQ